MHNNSIMLLLYMIGLITIFYYSCLTVMFWCTHLTRALRCIRGRRLRIWFGPQLGQAYSAGYFWPKAPEYFYRGTLRLPARTITLTVYWIGTMLILRQGRHLRRAIWFSIQ